MALPGATLHDYLNSVETDGTVTDHVRREATNFLNIPYTATLNKQKLQLGKKLWNLRYTMLQQRGSKK